MIHPEANDTLTVRSVFIIDPNKKVARDADLSREHRPSLRRNPPGHRFAATHRQPLRGHPGQLDAGQRRRDPSGDSGPEIIKQKFPKGHTVLRPYLRLTPQPNK